ncbi:MAG TPA: DUF1990 family protein [Segeticoccus sp.]|nr:DUF1990 family protein [Segeticoccus sp.]
MLSMVARWLLGTSLVTWRYLWMTTPLHREEVLGESLEDLPPAIPAELFDDRVQLAGSGVGPLFHRRFTVQVVGARRSAGELMALLIDDFSRFVPREVVAVKRRDGGRLREGQEFVVQMPGPWDGPVRVLEVGPRILRLATLEGHLEAGQIQFSGRDDEVLTFEVEAWARSADQSVRLLYAHLRVAKEIQFNMWVRFCLSAAELAGGRPRDGVHVVTKEVPESALPVDEQVGGGPRLADGPPVPLQVFPFRFARSYAPAAALFGVTATSSDVRITPEELQIRFGPWRLRTPRSNIADVVESGGFSWPKTAGPAHVSLADRGITFATNGGPGVCISFHEPVPGIEPTGRIRHPGATVTVADPQGLRDALR